MTSDLLSIILVSYNSKDDLEACLASLDDLAIPHEVIVVDNNSKDGTVSWLRGNHKDVVIVETGFNAGYADGNNIGAAVANGTYFLILNPDTTVEKGSIERLYQFCLEHPDTVVTPKILRVDGTVNACGNTMHFSGITSCTGLGQSAEAYQGLGRTLLVSGAAFMVPRHIWEALEGFDTSLFMYMEDADFSLRAWLHGYSVACMADAVVYHNYHLNLSAQKFYLLERNRLAVLLKLYETRTIRKLWLGLFFAELATVAYAVQKGPKYVGARIRGYWWIVRHARKIRQKRTILQSHRMMSDQALFAMMRPYLPFQDLTSPRLAHVLSLVTTPFFRTVHRSVVHL